MKGFSIIELIMVILIGSIIGAVVLIGIRLTPTSTLDLAAKKLKNDIIYMREKAISTNKKYKIYISTPSNFKAGFANYTLIIDPFYKSSFNYNISENYPNVMVFKNYSILFDSLGRNVYKNQTSIIIKSGTNVKIIKIKSETGRVYVE